MVVIVVERQEGGDFWWVAHATIDGEVHCSPPVDNEYAAIGWLVRRLAEAKLIPIAVH